MRLVLDTNVIVSAIIFGGNPERILLEIARKHHVFLVSPFLLDELANILARKAHWNSFQIQETLRGLRQIYILVEPKVTIKKIRKDITDNRILELAISGKADYIISGDKKHFLPLKRFRGIPILSPADFLKKVIYN